jgi:hypothetical protein
MPRAPWLTRLPSGVRSALTWCAAGLFALRLAATCVVSGGCQTR